MKWGAFYRQSKNLRYLHNRRELVGSFTEEQWQTLCSFFNGVCPRCQRETKEFSKDHIKALSRGGTNTIDNIQPLCLECNIKKSNLYSIDYRPDYVIEWIRKEVDKNV